MSKNINTATNRELVPGLYRHFKGNMYYVIAKTSPSTNISALDTSCKYYAIDSENPGNLISVDVTSDGRFISVIENIFG